MFVINRTLLPAKGHYFAFFGAIAGVLPFLVSIAMQFGASPSVVGYIYSSLPFIVLLAKAVFGAIADKYQQKKSILIGSVVVVASAYFIIDFIPSILNNGTIETTNASLQCVNYTNEPTLLWCLPRSSSSLHNEYQLNDQNCSLKCSPGGVFSENICKNYPDYCALSNMTIDYSSLISSFNITSNISTGICYDVNFKNDDFQFSPESLCDNVTQLDCDLRCASLQQNSREYKVADGLNYQVIALWFCMAFAYMGTGVVVSLGDAMILDLLEKKENFGRERLWGAVGWGLLSVATGQLIDWFSVDSKNLNFTPGMYVVLICSILDIIIILPMKVIKTEKPKRIFNNVGKLFLQPEVAIFTLNIFIVGCLTSVLWTFLIVYLNDLGASQFLVGLTMAVQCFLGEIPFFFISNWFLKKLGHNHAMTLVLIVFAFRLICYSLIENPWLVLPIELTQGITYGIFFTALATYGNLKAHPSIHSTVQGILQGMFEGFGVGIGSIISGHAYEYFGAKRFFLFTGILAGILSFIIGTIQCYLLRGKGRNYIIQNTDIKNIEMDGDKTETSKMILKNSVDTHHSSCGV